MSSSQSALLILLALWLVATLLLTSTQLRVIGSDPPRRWRYVLAWFSCTLIGGAVLSFMDGGVGQIDWPRRFANFGFAAAVSAAGLGAGAWVTRRPEWLARNRVVRFVALVVLHALVALIVALPFI